MRLRALPAVTALALSLAGCGGLPAPGTPTAPTQASTTAPGVADGGTPTAGGSAPSGNHPVPPAQAKLPDVVGPVGRPVPDPDYLLEAVRAHTAAAKTNRVSSKNGRKGGSYVVDQSDPRAPKADVYLSDLDRPDLDRHILIIGDTYYERVLGQGPEYGRIPMAQLPEESRFAAQQYLDVTASVPRDIQAGADVRVEYVRVDTTTTPTMHVFRAEHGDDVSPGTRGESIEFWVDPDLRLRRAIFHTPEAEGYELMFSEYDTQVDIQAPPERDVVDVPRRKPGGTPGAGKA